MTCLQIQDLLLFKMHIGITKPFRKLSELQFTNSVVGETVKPATSRGVKIPGYSCRFHTPTKQLVISGCYWSLQHQAPIKMTLVHSGCSIQILQTSLKKGCHIISSITWYNSNPKPPNVVKLLNWSKPHPPTPNKKHHQLVFVRAKKAPQSFEASMVLSFVWSSGDVPARIPGFTASSWQGTITYLTRGSWENHRLKSALGKGDILVPVTHLYVRCLYICNCKITIVYIYV